MPLRATRTERPYGPLRRTLTEFTDARGGQHAALACGHTIGIAPSTHYREVGRTRRCPYCQAGGKKGS